MRPAVNARFEVCAYITIVDKLCVNGDVDCTEVDIFTDVLENLHSSQPRLPCCSASGRRAHQSKVAHAFISDVINIQDR